MVTVRTMLAIVSWRMPNRNELLSLSDRTQTNIAQYFDYTYRDKDGSVFQAPIFSNYMENEFYWTSTTDPADTTEAWTVYSCDFGVYDIPKTEQRLHARGSIDGSEMACRDPTTGLSALKVSFSRRRTPRAKDARGGRPERRRPALQ